MCLYIYSTYSVDQEIYLTTALLRSIYKSCASLANCVNLKGLQYFLKNTRLQKTSKSCQLRYDTEVTVSKFFNSQSRSKSYLQLKRHYVMIDPAEHLSVNFLDLLLRLALCSFEKHCIRSCLRGLCYVLQK